LSAEIRISFLVWRGSAWLLMLAWMLMIHGCAGNRVTALANKYQLVPQTVTGGKFHHQLFLNQRPGNYLHVYIEGDGKAWLTPSLISSDPTPDNPMMLELLSVDTAPAIYLGRPCYYTADDAQCSPPWWTDRRYAEEVIDSLSRVISRFAADYEGIVLIGHSGGGTLAMLLAGRRPDVRMVVTLAGNLDIEAWAALHSYTPLYGSINPRHQPPLGGKIRQLHYIGETDPVITVELLKLALQQQRHYELRVIPDLDHACCWPEIWPSILTEVNRILPP
jgi:pimeloyl-ACP methyl ester carboxylesterase